MRRTQISTVLLLGTLTVFLTGCSRNPVAPEVMSPLNDGASSLVGAQVDDTPAPTEGGNSNVSTVTFNPSDEGVLTAGRWTLVLHKNSLKMATTITLRVADENAMEVEVVVTPPEANNFKVPVELTASMNELPTSAFDNLTMFYWDGAWAEVVDVASHPNQKNVVARMKQAATCRVGERDTNLNRMED